MNPIVWHPKHPEKSNMARFMRFVYSRTQQLLEDYEALHHWSVEHPTLFWKALVEFFNVSFDIPETAVLNTYQHMLEARWFEGARLNYAQQLLTRNDEHPALVCVDEQGNRQVISYQALRQLVGRCAAGLKQAGVGPGSRVAAVLPNTSYTLIAFLATASIGAIWSSCSPDFGTEAIADRLGQVEPCVLFVANGYQYNGKINRNFSALLPLIAALPGLTQVVVCPVLQPELTAHEACTIAVRWDDFLDNKEPVCFSPQPFNHPLYILFSSGTTGKPKCIVHGAGGVLLQHLKELGLHTDLGPQDNLFFHTTCGWMMWNWMVSVLALGATLTLYDGSPVYPTANRLFQLVDEEQVSVFGTSAKFLSLVKKEKITPNQTLTLSALRCILSTGSPLLPGHYDFVMQHVKAHVQLCSISGGTDIVSCFALGNPMLPVYRGELQCMGLGMAVNVFDEEGNAVRELRGELVCTRPFPSMPVGFWGDVEQMAYRHAYFERFPGVWAHGDYAEITAHNGLIIYGRSDTVLNPGGVRIGTAEIYRQVEKISDVLESVVISQDWKDDVRVVLFVKLKPGVALDLVLEENIRRVIRQGASARHVPAKIIAVPEIPYTINGKLMELAVRQAVHGQEIKNRQSIANPDALAYFQNRVELQE